MVPSSIRDVELLAATPYHDPASLITTEFHFAKGSVLKKALKVTGLVVFMSMLGVVIGSVPGFLRAGSAPLNAKKFEARSGFSNVTMQSPDHGILDVKAVFHIGHPSARSETRAQHLIVKAKDGSTAFEEELDRVPINAGDRDLVFPVEKRVNLPSGEYLVKLYSHDPDTTLLEDGELGPAIASWEQRVVTVK
jgi:hypothetical protein